MTDYEQSNPEQPEPAPPRQHVSARVPEHVSRGVFSTGVLVMTGPNEFVLDFIQNLGGPAQVAARIVMPAVTVGQFIQALETNLDLYKNRFGEPPEMPRPPQPAKKTTVQQIYRRPQSIRRSHGWLLREWCHDWTRRRRVQV